MSRGILSGTVFSAFGEDEPGALPVVAAPVAGGAPGVVVLPAARWLSPIAPVARPGYRPLQVRVPAAALRAVPSSPPIASLTGFGATDEGGIFSGGVFYRR